MFSLHFLSYLCFVRYLAGREGWGGGWWKTTSDRLKSSWMYRGGEGGELTIMLRWKKHREVARSDIKENISTILHFTPVCLLSSYISLIRFYLHFLHFLTAKGCLKIGHHLIFHRLQVFRRSTFGTRHVTHACGSCFVPFHSKEYLSYCNLTATTGVPFTKWNPVTLGSSLLFTRYLGWLVRSSAKYDTLWHNL